MSGVLVPPSNQLFVFGLAVGQFRNQIDFGTSFPRLNELADKVLRVVSTALFIASCTADTRKLTFRTAVLIAGLAECVSPLVGRLDSYYNHRPTELVLSCSHYLNYGFVDHYFWMVKTHFAEHLRDCSLVAAGFDSTYRVVTQLINVN